MQALRELMSAAAGHSIWDAPHTDVQLQYLRRVQPFGPCNAPVWVSVAIPLQRQQKLPAPASGEGRSRSKLIALLQREPAPYRRLEAAVLHMLFWV